MTPYLSVCRPLKTNTRHVRTRGSGIVPGVYKTVVWLVTGDRLRLQAFASRPRLWKDGAKWADMERSTVQNAVRSEKLTWQDAAVAVVTVCGCQKKSFGQGVWQWSAV